ncbi:hypothetical protein B481_1142 [Planococcus halocryophilus Or1]|uniref:hypothetical protein n=1 Tax=Planococcus halocryophilus TaxID=1215089 RepID=UPI0002B855EB|nr:hypothetical protein [Planococcus halocryophilus]EMF47546.1 hypothetical protein B481_1142 [Planococcus halocryophilus Or1]
MWITEHEIYEVDDFKEGILIGQKILSIKVKRNIIIENHYAGFHFMNTSISTIVESVKYNAFTLSIRLPYVLKEGSRDIELYGFNNFQFRILKGKRLDEGSLFVFDEFSEMAAGLWRMFLYADHKLYSLYLENDFTESVSSYHHQFKILCRESYLYLELQPHTMEIDFISIEEKQNSEILFRFH